MCTRALYDVIPHSQHRQHGVPIKLILTPFKQPFRRRFNLRRANWDDFTSELETNVDNLGPASWRKYSEFSETVRSLVRRHIPRGCRTKYIPGLSSCSVTLLMEYQHLYNSDPFSEDTIEAGQILCSQLKATCQQQWEEMVENIDLTNNSKKGWQTLFKLSSNPKPTTSYTVTPDQVAHQILNRKPDKSSKLKMHKMKLRSSNSGPTILSTFTMKELDSAISSPKHGPGYLD